jgi:hypothetical protein
VSGLLDEKRLERRLAVGTGKLLDDELLTTDGDRHDPLLGDHALGDAQPSHDVGAGADKETLLGANDLRRACDRRRTEVVPGVPGHVVHVCKVSRNRLGQTPAGQGVGVRQRR